MTTPSPDHDRDMARRRLSNALARLRYSGAVGHRIGIDSRASEIDYLNSVTDWLEKFGSALADGVDKSTAKEKQLVQLHRDIAGMRRIFGL